MKYTLTTVRRFHVDIIDNAGQKIGRAFLYAGRGWEIYNNDHDNIGLARWKREIIPFVEANKNKLKPLSASRVKESKMRKNVSS